MVSADGVGQAESQLLHFAQDDKFADKGNCC
jgi:hypothetical protein